MTPAQRALVLHGVVDVLDPEDSVALVTIGEHVARVSRVGGLWRGFIVHSIEPEDQKVWKTNIIEGVATRKALLAALAT